MPMLPGITTLTRPVVRERATLDLLQRERRRTGPSKASGPQMVKSLDLVAEIGGTGLGKLELDAVGPERALRAGGVQEAGTVWGRHENTARERGSTVTRSHWVAVTP
ncbi:hypothetical protein [Nonomuraea purpurea]|uniref:hypothetical protein n=1 Tax=Nonomuraea purpurea TaxID=1849276 RepID=UPI0036D3AA74